MELLKLVIVDDEAILLQGLLQTYDWEQMGFRVVGSAMSGEQAIEVIEKERPDVVLTDIRMRQISGLMVMEEMAKRGIDCLFIVLSAYRDFEYAQKACDMGAYAYLLKPIEDDKLTETMRGAYEQCMKKIRETQKLHKMENILRRDENNFLQVMVQKYIRGEILQKQMMEIFEMLEEIPQPNEKYIAVFADIDLVYQITSPADFENSRLALAEFLERELLPLYPCYHFIGRSGVLIYILHTEDNGAVQKARQMLEEARNAINRPLAMAVSRPYKGIEGLQASCVEADRILMQAGENNEGIFAIRKTEEDFKQREMMDAISSVLSAIRKNADADLKNAFVSFIYQLPPEEEKQCGYIHYLMIHADDMLMETYGMTDRLRDKFGRYYQNLQNLSPSRAIDVCYKILLEATQDRKEIAAGDDGKSAEKYMADALGFIEENLQDENLSIVSVALYVFLNPVYFGRVFKNAMQMTFRQYLLQRRMEKAKKMLQEGDASISTICETVGISNPSYFTHLFKQYAGILPSDYKKEYEA